MKVDEMTELLRRLDAGESFDSIVRCEFPADALLDAKVDQWCQVRFLED